MNLELIVQEKQKGTIYDISSLVSTATWETQISGQAGKLTFSFYKDKQFMLSEGSPVMFKVDGVGLFYGTVFTHEISKDGKYSTIAYDQLRYFKNCDTKVYSKLTASQIFELQCKENKLKHQIVNSSSCIIAPYVHDNKSLFDMNQHNIDETLIKTGNWYIIKDTFGTLEFLNINNLKTTLYIGDEKLLLDYNFKSSIDDDTYNQVRLVKDNKKTMKREVYIVKDSSTIAKWGTLQYFEKMDENANAAQIQQKAEMLLKLKNRVKKTLKLDCLGDKRVFGGSGVILDIDDLAKEGVVNNEYYMVLSASHTFTKDLHTMNLEMQVSI